MMDIYNKDLEFYRKQTQAMIKIYRKNVLKRKKLFKRTGKIGATVAGATVGYAGYKKYKSSKIKDKGRNK